jgi:hypothetical protein
MNKEKYNKKEIIAALVVSKGTVYIAARRLGCAANTIYRFAEKYPEVKEAMHHERGMQIDVAELQLQAAVNRGEPWAIALTLKTIGKDRGYTERTEVTGADGGAINIKIEDIRNLSDDELNALTQG